MLGEEIKSVDERLFGLEFERVSYLSYDLE